MQLVKEAHSGTKDGRVVFTKFNHKPKRGYGISFFDPNQDSELIDLCVGIKSKVYRTREQIVDEINGLIDHKAPHLEYVTRKIYTRNRYRIKGSLITFSHCRNGWKVNLPIGVKIWPEYQLNAFRAYFDKDLRFSRLKDATKVVEEYLEYHQLSASPK